MLRPKSSPSVTVPRREKKISQNEKGQIVITLLRLTNVPHAGILIAARFFSEIFSLVGIAIRQF